MSKEERKASSMLERVELKGPISDDKKLAKDFMKMMDDIYAYYEMDHECIFRLKDETCDKCGHKLTIKGQYEKEIKLPGGSSVLLTFYRYYCNGCKEPANRHISKIFEPNKQYSKNIKSDAIRLYSTHLSSYEAVTTELNKLYKTNISKKTVISWLVEAGLASEQATLEDEDFSGHILYDEEYVKVFNGDVGKKHSRLEKTDYYLLLFRDAMTKKVIIKFTNHLDEKNLISAWEEVFIHLRNKGIEVKSFGTDGKREYKRYIEKINRRHNMNVQHVYDAFHFIQNLYKSANKEIFGVEETKKELPKFIINQIETIHSFFRTKDINEAQEKVNELFSERWTFIKALRDPIFRLKHYFKDYTYFLEIPEMKTTDLCEGWFARTKPKKLKREYKKRIGIRSIANMLAVRINYNWKEKLDMDFDFSQALNGLLGIIKAKYQ